VSDYVNEVIAKTGEKCHVRRFVRYQGDLVVAYIHHGGKIGVMLELSGSGAAPEALAAAKDLAMQVAAANPMSVSRDEVDADTVAKEKAIYAAQAAESGKPANIIEKMVVGRLEKFYKEVCLLQQPFVKNQDQTVTQFLKEVGQKLGKDLQVKRFTRYQVGA
jgi:elongation factor Ts